MILAVQAVDDQRGSRACMEHGTSLLPGLEGNSEKLPYFGIGLENRLRGEVVIAGGHLECVGGQLASIFHGGDVVG